MDNLIRPVVILVAVLFVSLVAGGGGGDSEHVHLKIHIPKIIKKHTHVQTIYKHHFHKQPVHESSDEEDEDKDGSEKYIRIDPKITLAALKATNNFGGGGVTGNEFRSLKWTPKFNYHRSRDLKNAYSSPLKYKTVKGYPKNVKVVHDYGEMKEYPLKSHRIMKQMMPTYEIHEEMNDDQFGHQPEQEEYSESKPMASYLMQSPSIKSQQIQFIPASDVSQYIPTIPFSALTAQSQFQPIWTPAEFMARAVKNKEQARPGRSSSHYEGSTMRMYSTDGADSSLASPMLSTKRYRRNFLH